MNVYTATEQEIRAAFKTHPGKILHVCCSPVIQTDDNKAVPARSDVKLDLDDVIYMSRLDPVAGISAARHILPNSVLEELAKKEPVTALYFISDKLPAKLVAELRKTVELLNV